MTNVPHDKFTIIPITYDHVKDYNLLVSNVAKERKYLAFLEGPSLEMSQAFVQENIMGNWPHFVAIMDDKLIGWCDISSMHRDVQKHCGSLGIGVLDGYRGMGVGEALMLAALDKAKHKGLTRVELTVRENNTMALELYKKLGFVIEGLQHNAVKIDGNYENYISMALLFD
jgi:ribosomal protein S18 acetylase RimI-like enzyme